MSLFYIAVAIGAVICWGVSDFLIQKSVRRVGLLPALIWGGVVGVIILTPLVMPELKLLRDWNNLRLILLFALVTLIGALAQFKAYKDGKLSVVDTIVTLELPLTVALGVYFLKDKLTMAQILFIVMAFFGIVLISRHRATFWEKIKGLFTGKVRFLEKAVLLTLFVAFMNACINLSIAVSARQVSPLLTVWFGWLFCAIFGSVFLLSTGQFKNTYTNCVDCKKLLLAMGIFDVAAWSFFALAVSQEELSITTAITECYPVVSILLAVIVNREKISRLQIIGVILALAASVLIGLTL